MGEEKPEIKTVMVGETSVGKTCLVKRIVNSEYNEETAPTLGANFSSKDINIDGVTYTVQVWDTAGQERYRAMAPMYYRNSKAAIVVYAIDNKKSFEQVDGWASSVRECIGKTAALFIVGNKCDLDDKRAVSTIEGQDKAAEYSASFLEVSAKEGIGCDELLTMVAQTVVSREAHLAATTVQEDPIKPAENSNGRCC